MKIVIRGAGIIGLSIAWKLKQHGIRACILDAHDETEKASWAAAGMLSADFEAVIDPEADVSLHALSLRSVALWGEFVRTLESAADVSLFYASGPSLGLLPPDFDLSRVQGLLQSGRIVPLTAQDIRQTCVGLNLNGHCPVEFRKDGQVDNRTVLRALMQVCRDMISSDASKTDTADLIIECRGWRSPDMRPVKGQMLSLKPMAGAPTQPVRWGAAYIVPKPDRIIIGASVEPGRTDLETDETTLKSLFEAAVSFYPILRDGEKLQSWSGLRPMAKSQTPCLEWQDDGRVFMATGHYRNGILLAPVTAEIVYDAVLARLSG